MNEYLGNPKVFAVMLLLCLLLAGHYYTAHFTKRLKMPQGYLGSASHEHSMLSTIETIALRRLLQFPAIDDATLFGMVRDEMRQQNILQVDLYEATIYAVVRRLRTDDQMPGSRPPRPPVD